MQLNNHRLNTTDPKQRYKLYKSGKFLVTGMLTVFGLSGVLLLSNTTSVQADTTSSIAETSDTPSIPDNDAVSETGSGADSVDTPNTDSVKPVDNEPETNATNPAPVETNTTGENVPESNTNESSDAVQSDAPTENTPTTPTALETRTSRPEISPESKVYDGNPLHSFGSASYIDYSTEDEFHIPELQWDDTDFEFTDGLENHTDVGNYNIKLTQTGLDKLINFTDTHPEYSFAMSETSLDQTNQYFVFGIGSITAAQKTITVANNTANVKDGTVDLTVPTVSISDTFANNAPDPEFNWTATDFEYLNSDNKVVTPSTAGTYKIKLSSTGQAKLDALTNYQFEVKTGTLSVIDLSRTVTVKFIDDDLDGIQVGELSSLSGVTGQTVNWSFDVPANYLSADDLAIKGTYTFQSDDNPTIIIHLKHRHTGTNLAALTTNTVTYTGKDDLSTKTDISNVYWNSNVDEVTKTTTWTSVYPVTRVLSPDVPGYTPSQKEINFTNATVVTDGSVPADQSATVSYSPNEQRVWVQFYDSVTGEKFLNACFLKGLSDQDYKLKVPLTITVKNSNQNGLFTPAAVSESALPIYQLDTSRSSQEVVGTFDHNDSSDTDVTVFYKPVDYQRELRVVDETGKIFVDRVTTTNVNELSDLSTEPLTLPTGYHMIDIIAHWTNNETGVVTDAKLTDVPFFPMMASRYGSGVNLFKEYLLPYINSTHLSGVDSFTKLTASRGSLSSDTLPTTELAVTDAHNSSHILLMNYDFVVASDNISFTVTPIDTNGNAIDSLTPIEVTGLMDSPLTFPTIPGYTVEPDQALTVPQTNGTNVNVKYTADEQTVPVKIIDQTTGSQIGDAVTLTGTTDSSQKWTLTKLLQQANIDINNYVAAENQATSGTYVFKATESPELLIYVDHNIMHSDGVAAITHVYVNYSGAGSKTPATADLLVNWYMTLDQATNAVTWTSEQQPLEVQSPTIVGYTANKPVATFQDTFEFGPSPSGVIASPTPQTIKVIYTANQTNYVVTPVDVTGEPISSAAATNETGKTDQLITTFPKIPGYTVQTGQKLTVPDTDGSNVNAVYVPDSSQFELDGGTQSWTKTENGDATSVEATPHTVTPVDINGNPIDLGDTPKPVVTGIDGDAINTPELIGYKPVDSTVTLHSNGGTTAVYVPDSSQFELDGGTQSWTKAENGDATSVEATPHTVTPVDINGNPIDLGDTPKPVVTGIDGDEVTAPDIPGFKSITETATLQANGDTVVTYVPDSKQFGLDEGTKHYEVTTSNDVDQIKNDLDTKIHDDLDKGIISTATINASPINDAAKVPSTDTDTIPTTTPNIPDSPITDVTSIVPVDQDGGSHTVEDTNIDYSADGDDSDDDFTLPVDKDDKTTQKLTKDEVTSANNNQSRLPQTGESADAFTALLGMLMAATLALVPLKKKRNQDKSTNDNKVK